MQEMLGEDAPNSPQEVDYVCFTVKSRKIRTPENIAVNPVS